MARFLCTPEHDQLLSDGPIWVIGSIGGMSSNGCILVTRTNFRVLYTPYNMGLSPEPNIAVLWSGQLPRGLKGFCAKISVDVSLIQYENDDLMYPDFNSNDYAIVCYVSPVVAGK